MLPVDEPCRCVQWLAALYKFQGSGVTVTVRRVYSLTKAERFLAHDIDKLFSLLEGIIPE